jgi:hypothetical protein
MQGELSGGAAWGRSEPQFILTIAPLPPYRSAMFELQRERDRASGGE